MRTVHLWVAKHATVKQSSHALKTTCGTRYQSVRPGRWLLELLFTATSRCGEVGATSTQKRIVIDRIKWWWKRVWAAWCEIFIIWNKYNSLKSIRTSINTTSSKGWCWYTRVDVNGWLVLSLNAREALLLSQILLYSGSCHAWNITLTIQTLLNSENVMRK